MKDHEIAALVNALRDIAIKYHDAQQLRERIAALVVPALRGKRSPERSRVNHVPLRTLTDAECEAIGMEFGPTRLAVNYTTLGRRMVNCVVAALQQSSSGITAGAEKPTQVVDSGAAGPTRTGDLLITNQGAETAETLGNQQDTPTPAPAEGAKVAQGESITCEGVTAGLRPPADRIRRVLNFAATHALAALAELERERERHADVREIITSVVCAALNRAGINDVDNPGDAIDAIRNRAENAERERDELRAGLERLTRLYEDEHDLCDRPIWLQELIARPTRKDGE